MKSYKINGFTLIELLAVIVILAIIALIAAPIMLDIIDNTKQESNERSLEMYAKAIENAMFTYQLKSGENRMPTTLNEIEQYLEYDGNIECQLEIHKDGSIYLDQCKFNNVLLEEYTYGTPQLTTYVKKLYNSNTTATNGSVTYNLDTINSLMNDRLGGITEDLNEGNVRYYGQNPNNYVDIGDRDSEGNIILWRIIGLFKNVEKSDGSKEDLIKIIRAETLGNYTFDNKTKGIGSSITAYGSNDWSDARLMKLLNPGYEKFSDSYDFEGSLYWNSKSGTCYSGAYDKTAPCDFSNIGLSEQPKKIIESVVWDMTKYSNPNVYINDLYTKEVLEKWTGKVALMHHSDYGYATDFTQCKKTLTFYSDDKCKSNNWLYDNSNEWLITPVTNQASLAWRINEDGGVTGYGGDTSRVLYSRSVRPTLYLTSDLMIESGNGTSDNPYVLK